VVTGVAIGLGTAHAAAAQQPARVPMPLQGDTSCTMPRGGGPTVPRDSFAPRPLPPNGPERRTAAQQRDRQYRECIERSRENVQMRAPDAHREDTIPDLEGRPRRP
jgi:hypothetical protein